MLDEIRDRARAQIHERFSLPAVARSNDGLVEITGLNIRFHRDVKKPFGDLDREGFAMLIEMHNQIIVDREQWDPIKKYKVDFGRDRVVSIANIVSPKSERYVVCEVTEVSP